MPKKSAKTAPNRAAKSAARGARTVKPAAKTAKTDFVGLELAYTTTPRILEDLGREFGLSIGRISQLAKERGWKRGALADRVRAQAAAKVAAKEAHDAQVQAGTEAAIEVSAVLMADTILRERRDVGRLIRVANLLMDQVEAAATRAVGAKKPKTGEAAPDPLGVQVDNLRKLGTTMNQLITLERDVMNIHGWTPIDPAKGVAEAINSGVDALKARFAEIDRKHGARA